MKFASLLILTALLPLSASAFAPFKPSNYGTYQDCLALSQYDLPVGANPYVFCRPLLPKPEAMNAPARELIVPASYETGAEGAR